MSSSPKRITVFGATGAQGSSVLRSLAANTTTPFTLRAITRNPSSAKAQQLSALGIEVVKADGWDTASLLAAFADTWGVFVNTNSDDAVFENPEETRTELDLGKNVVDAAVEAGVRVFVYSGMASARESSGGMVSVQAFDEKHAIGAYAQSLNAFTSVAIVSPSWYFENFLVEDMAPIFGGFPFIPSEDGTLVFRAPLWGGKEYVPFIAIGDDYSDLVHAVFLDPPKWNGKLVQAVSDILSLDEVTKTFERVTGKMARFEPLPKWQDLEVYGVRALETVKGMFGFCQEAGGRYYGVETEKETARALKKVAAEARGKPDEGVLMGLEDFFRREFGGK